MPEICAVRKYGHAYGVLYRTLYGLRPDAARTLYPLMSPQTTSYSVLVDRWDFNGEYS